MAVISPNVSPYAAAKVEFDRIIAESPPAENPQRIISCCTKVASVTNVLQRCNQENGQERVSWGFGIVCIDGGCRYSISDMAAEIFMGP